jgi:hypothetical protein
MLITINSTPTPSRRPQGNRSKQMLVDNVLANLVEDFRKFSFARMFYQR